MNTLPMKKVIFAGALAGMLLVSTGCGEAPVSSRLEDMFVDLVCMVSDARNQASSVDFSTMTGETLTNKVDELQQKTDQLKKDQAALPQKYGFKSTEEVQAALKNVPMATFRNTVAAKAKGKCGATQDMANMVLNTPVSAGDQE